MLTPNGGVFGRNPKFNNVTVDGNLTVNGDIALGDDITVTDTLTVNGVTTVANTTESTTASNGALVVAGGVGIAKRLNVTGAAAIAGITTVSNTTGSTSTTTGALVVSGGIGVAGVVRAGSGAFVGTPVSRITGSMGLLDNLGFVRGIASLSRPSSHYCAGLAYCPSNDTMYAVSNVSATANIYHYNTVSGSFSAITGTSVRSYRITYCPTNNSMYISDFAAGNVKVVSCATNTITATLTVGTSPEGIAFVPGSTTANDRIWIANAGDDDITVINPNDNTQDGSDISLGVGPDTPRDLCYCPSNDTVYVCCAGSDNVVPIPCSTKTAGTPIAVGDQPFCLAYCPSNNKIYVANYGDDNVDSINCATDTVATADIAVGNTPIGIAYNPRTDRIYVIHEDTAAPARIIDPQRDAVCQTLPSGTRTYYAAAYCPSSGRMYAGDIGGARILT